MREYNSSANSYACMITIDLNDPNQALPSKHSSNMTDYYTFLALSRCCLSMARMKKSEWAMVCPYSYVSYTMILSFFDVGDRGLTSLGTIRPADDGHDVSWTTLRSHRSTPLPPAGCSHCFICSSYVLHAFPVAEMRRLPTSASLPAKGLSNCWISTLNLPHFPLLLFVTCFIKQNQEDIRHFSLTTQMICTGLQWANKIFLIKIISSRPINSW